jgi:hypothetical protein
MNRRRLELVFWLAGVALTALYGLARADASLDAAATNASVVTLVTCAQGGQT